MSEEFKPALRPVVRSTEAAPFVYFDTTSAFGTFNGVVQIELVSRAMALAPLADGGVQSEFLTTARLRCSPTAAASLRDAIDKALEMLKAPQQAQRAAPCSTLN